MAKSRPGFSVIEALIAIAISITVGIVISQSFFDGWQAQVNQETYSELQRAGRFTLDEMSEQIWNATTVVSAITLNSTTYTSGTNTVVLRLPPLDSNGDIITGDDYLVFNENGATIERIISPAGSSIRASWQTPLSLHKETGDLQLQYFNASGVELVPGTNDLTVARKLRVTINSTRVSGTRTFNRQLDSMVILRNKGI